MIPDNYPILLFKMLQWVSGKLFVDNENYYVFFYTRIFDQ